MSEQVSVMGASRARGNSRLVLAALVARSVGQAGCTVSVAEIQREVCASRSAVKRAIRWLRASGEVVSVQSPGKTPCYRVLVGSGSEAVQ